MDFYLQQVYITLVKLLLGCIPRVGMVYTPAGVYQQVYTCMSQAQSALKQQ
jgi:hypothetical protein